MSKCIEQLRKWGCDVDAAMERMLNDEEFYIECLTEIPDDENFGILKDALEKHDIEKAFDAAHTLKGVLANLGLTPMYHKAVELVEPLRSGTDKDLMPKFYELNSFNDYLKAILSEGNEEDTK